MVYCGKPSKGCSNCRERKIRCDQREPGCGQCDKRQQECPGYRNLLDLMFRDESSHVIKKATARRKKKVTTSPTTSNPSPIKSEYSDHSSQWTASTPSDYATPQPSSNSVVSRDKRLKASPIARKSKTSPISRATPEKESASFDTIIFDPEPRIGPVGPLSYNLGPTCQERGCAYFMSRWVTVDENACHQRFDFLFDIWKPHSLLPSRQDDAVLASMTAVGLVGVANMSRSQQALDAARKSYGEALRLTNTALRNPDEALKDTTMLSIIILALFEMNTDSRLGSMQAWHQHINGAAALAKLRGMSQFRSKTGIRIFMALCHNIMIACIQKELPMPQELVAMRHHLSTLFQKAPGLEVSSPMATVLQLRYDIKQGNITDLDVMIRRLAEAEADFERVAGFYPDTWKYRRFRLLQAPPVGFFSDVCHVYRNLATATLWNGVRSCRMLVLETMLEELSNCIASTPMELVSERYQVEYQKTKSKLERITLAILNSVPQHFGLLNPLDECFNALAPVAAAEEPFTDPPHCQVSSYGDSPTSSGGSPDSNGSNDDSPHVATFVDPLQTKKAKRFLDLAAATDTLVWPLYLVGMSSVCSSSMRAFVIDRLTAVHVETGLVQAKAVASVVATVEVAKTDSKSWNSIYEREIQRPLVLPV